MAKGQKKSGRSDKKPKQDKSKSTAGKSAYAMGRDTKVATSPFGKKK